MLQEITGCYGLQAQVDSFVKEAERMVQEYGWQERTVHPYSFPMKVTKIVDDLKDYERCTSGSKLYLIGLANGLAEIMNAWEEQEKAPKIRVMVLDSGKVIEIEEDFARQLINEGICKAV